VENERAEDGTTLKFVVQGVEWSGVFENFFKGAGDWTNMNNEIKKFKTGNDTKKFVCFSFTQVDVSLF
jgi:hypothetical protein